MEKEGRWKEGEVLTERRRKRRVRWEVLLCQEERKEKRQVKGGKGAGVKGCVKACG